MDIQVDEFDQRISEIFSKYSNRGSSADCVYWTIRDAIRTNIIFAGNRLVELDLAEILGTSRTPVREALQRLESEGLLRKEPRRGFIVPTISREDLVQIFEIKEVLFGMAARLSAERITQTEITVMGDIVKRMEAALAIEDIKELTELSYIFHRMIHSGTKNPRLQTLIAYLDDSHQSYYLHEYSISNRISLAIEEHRHIYEAIAKRDGILAEQLAREHTISALKAQLTAHQFDVSG